MGSIFEYSYGLGQLVQTLRQLLTISIFLLTASTQTQALPSLTLPKDEDVYLVFAHADDELSILGAVANNPRVHWIVVTDGAAARGSPMDRKGRSMAEIREDEARQVAECMKIGSVLFMNVPDGHVSEEPLLAEKLKALLFSPGREAAMIFTHDSHGFYGHRDHVATYQAVKNAVAGKPVALVSAAFPKGMQKNFYLKMMMLFHGMKPQFESVTHELSLTPVQQNQLICADDAYYSQRNLLKYFRKGLQPEEFYRGLPSEFFHLF